MGKILVFAVTVPILCFLVYKAVFFYEYDTRQRYLKDLVDNATEKVRLTGVFTSEEYEELEQKLTGIQIKTDPVTGIVMKKGSFSEGELAGMASYMPGERLRRGDAFMLFVVSSNPAKLSDLLYGGGPLLGNELYYKAKAFCRVECAG